MKMTIAEIDEFFKVDEEGRFVNLILPNDKLGAEIDLRGKRQLDMSIDEIVRIKKYASKLYEEATK